MHIKKFSSFINEDAGTPGEFTQGATYKMKRSTDGKVYNVELATVNSNYMLAIIDGPGTYEGAPLHNRQLEVYLTQDKKGLHGNTELGVFTKVA